MFREYFCDLVISFHVLKLLEGFYLLYVEKMCFKYKVQVAVSVVTFCN